MIRQGHPTSLCSLCAAMAALGVAGAAAPADAFQTKRSREGAEVRWDSDFVMYKLNEAGSQDLGPDKTRGAVLRAFNAWVHPDSALRLVYGGETPDAAYGYDRSGQNSNLITFEEQDWSFDPNTLAVTLTTFNAATGQMLDADIVVNGTHFAWSGDGDPGVHDLSNSLTHEVGHFIGLDHSEETDATMYASAPIGEIKKRDLSLDDQLGLLALYGTGQQALVGNDEPDLGGGIFGGGEVEDDGEPPSGVRINSAQLHLSCSSINPAGQTPLGSTPASPIAALGAMLLGLLAVRRRRASADATCASKVIEDQDLTHQIGRAAGGASGARALAAVVALAAALGGLLAAPGVASATTTRALSLEQLTLSSDRIVLGEVIARRAAFESGVIWTTATLRVESCPETLACREGEEVEVRTPGGVVGEIEQAVAGVKALEVGQRAVLFLALESRQGLALSYRPVGMSQGSMKVERVGSELLAHRDLGGLHLLHDDGAVSDGDALDGALPVADLFTRIAALRRADRADAP